MSDQCSDLLTMSGARADDETLGQDISPGSRAATPVMQSIEQDNGESVDPLDGYYPQVADTNMMPPPPRNRRDSLVSNQTDLNSPDVIASLVGPVRNGSCAASVPASPGASPRPRGLNLGNSVLNRRLGQASGGATHRARALSRQRDLASRLNRNSHDHQARIMTGTLGPQGQTERDATPFTRAHQAYQASQFSSSRLHLQSRLKRGKLNRHDEVEWITMETESRRRQDHRARSVTPGDDGDVESYGPAVVFREMKRIYDLKVQDRTITPEQNIMFMKAKAREEDRKRRQNSPLPNSRASTPSNASEIFVNHRAFRSQGFPTYGGDRSNGTRDPPRREKFVMSSKLAQKKSKRAERAGQLPNRSDPRARPRKGYGDDGRGRNLEFGDYFLKATANDERPDVIENYLEHVANEVARQIAEKGTMPLYTGTPLKDRLGQIRKRWNTKTKEFCRKYDLEPPPKGSKSDEEEQRFNRAKWNVYKKIRAGQLHLEEASRFGVEANIEMCRWRAKYHKAIGNTNAPSNLPDLDELDGLMLPTTEEFDTAYKPRYDKILEFVGQMFAECQDRIRINHDRLHGVFAKVEIPDPYEEPSSDEDEDEDEEAVAARAAAAAAAAEKADAEAERERRRAADDEDNETLFPNNQG